MRKIKILLVILGIVSSFAFGQGLPLPYGYGGFKPGSEPDGFRGIKWGTDISTLSGMKYVRTLEEDKNIQIYIRENEELKFGNATLERIEYWFWKGKFCDVVIITRGDINFEYLKQEVFKKFGKELEGFSWSGENTYMVLGYDTVSEVGGLWMWSKKMRQQMEEYQKQKTK